MQGSSERIAKRYARALFELCEPADFDRVHGALHSISETYASSGELQSTLNNPSLPNEIRLNILRDITKRIAAGQPHVERFIETIFEGGRFPMIQAVVAELEKMIAAFRRSLSFEVVTSSELPSAEQQQVLSTLQQKLGKEVSVRWSSDPKLVGGMQLKLGDRVLDGSVDGKLRRLYADMMS